MNDAIATAPSISILICTHNRAELLAETIASVAALDVDDADSVEVIVIANACRDDTVAVAERGLATLPFRGRCVEEPEPGLSVARNRAMDEARGDVFAFIDDDVLLDRDWLRGMRRAFRELPAGVVGGRVHLWWRDVPRPEWVDPIIAAWLSENDRGEEPVELHGDHGAIGANFAIHRDVRERVGGFDVRLGRKGSGLGGSEETDLMDRARRAGFRCFYVPWTSLRHYVPAKRLELDYLLGVCRGGGRSIVLRASRPGAGTVIKRLIGLPLLATRHTIGLGLAKLRGDRRGATRHAMTRAFVNGRWRATIESLKNRAG